MRGAVLVLLLWVLVLVVLCLSAHAIRHTRHQTHTVTFNPHTNPCAAATYPQTKDKSHALTHMKNEQPACTTHSICIHLFLRRAPPPQQPLLPRQHVGGNGGPAPRTAAMLHPQQLRIAPPRRQVSQQRDARAWLIRSRLRLSRLRGAAGDSQRSCVHEAGVGSAGRRVVVVRGGEREEGCECLQRPGVC